MAPPCLWQMVTCVAVSEFAALHGRLLDSEQPWSGICLTKPSSPTPCLCLSARPAQVDFVFLVHGLTVFSVLHLPYVWPAYAKDPFALEWYAMPFLPFLLIFFGFAYFISRVVVSYTYVLRGLNIQVWCMPRLGFNVSTPSMEML